MKDLRLLVWLTQLGLSVAFPLAGFILLALWLHSSLGWGNWVIWAGTAIGFLCAVTGFRDSLRAMDRMSRDDHKKEPPPVSFNDHS